MQSYLIVCKLGLPENQYVDLIAYLKTAVAWSRPADGVWLIKTGVDAAGIRDGIMSKVNSTDKVLVMEVLGKNWASSAITKEVTDWMKSNL